MASNPRSSTPFTGRGEARHGFPREELGEEYGRYGVRVNVVAPGNVGAGNFEHPPAEFGSDPVNPLAPPRGADLSDAVLFLASKLSDRITGQTILVDGGAVSRSAWNFGNLEDLARVPGMGVSDYDSENPTFPTRSLAETVGEWHRSAPVWPLLSEQHAMDLGDRNLGLADPGHVEDLCRSNLAHGRQQP